MSESFTITRVFDAPRELVFAAWTEPAQFARWFGGEADVPVETVTLDVRPGGAWRALMHLTDPQPMVLDFHGEFTEVVAPERLVFTLLNPMAPDDPTAEVITVTLTDLGGKTEMFFEQGDNLTAEEYVRTKEGWIGFFDRLAEGLAQR
jgi:uncharacterized protein YndB with AHSA1/START domain